MRHEVLPLVVPITNSNGTAQKITHMINAAVQYHGTGNITGKFQGKISGEGADAHDDWFDLEVAAATARVLQIPNGYTHVRFVTTAFTSGVMSAHVGGKNSRTDGG